MRVRAQWKAFQWVTMPCVMAFGALLSVAYECSGKAGCAAVRIAVQSKCGQVWRLRKDNYCGTHRTRNNLR